MAPSRLPLDFETSAAYPLYAIDPVGDRAWVLHFEPEDYREASFLDSRALQRREISGWSLAGEELRQRLPAASSLNDLHWLFHIGHCGSSLVSRLLDLIPGTLGLREPLPLLTLAHAPEAEQPWLPTVRALLGRKFADTQGVVVKPTSLVSTIAPSLLVHTGQACLLWVDLHTWLATMLRDEGLVSTTLGNENLRLRAVTGLSPADSVGARLARTWLAEQVRWHRLTRASEAGRLMDLDFAEVLADPAGAIGTLATHFSLKAPADLVDRIAASGLMNRYAKNTAQRFDAHQRAAELARASAQHGASIAQGVEWAIREIESLRLPHLLERLHPRT